jgi:hypothetical protein
MVEMLMVFCIILYPTKQNQTLCTTYENKLAMPPFRYTRLNILTFNNDDFHTNIIFLKPKPFHQPSSFEP